MFYNNNQMNLIIVVIIIIIIMIVTILNIPFIYVNRFLHIHTQKKVHIGQPSLVVARSVTRKWACAFEGVATITTSHEAECQGIKKKACIRVLRSRAECLI